MTSILETPELQSVQEPFQMIDRRSVQLIMDPPPSFSLLRNLITSLHLNFLPKPRKNYKNIAFRGRPAANCTLINN